VSSLLATNILLSIIAFLLLGVYAKIDKMFLHFLKWTNMTEMFKTRFER
jgi:hypothetical protein